MKIYVSNNCMPIPDFFQEVIDKLAAAAFEVTYWTGGPEEPKPTAAERFRFIKEADVVVIPSTALRECNTDAAIATGAEKPVVVVTVTEYDDTSVYSLPNMIIVRDADGVVEKMNQWRLATESFGPLRMMQIFATSEDLAWIVKATEALYGRVKPANKPYDFALLFKGAFVPLDEHNRIHPAHVIQFGDQAETLAVIGTSSDAVLTRLSTHLDALRVAHEKLFQQLNQKTPDATKLPDPAGNGRAAPAAS